MVGWSRRVRVVAGEKGYAYAPGRVLVPTADVGSDAVRSLLGVPNADGLVVDSTPLGDGTWSKVTYVGDVPSIVRQLKVRGVAAQPDHIVFAHADDRLDANPVYGSPVYGSPVYGSPVYGSPVYGSPVYGSPVYGSPVYGSPVYGSPVYGSPVYGSPVYGSGGGGGAGVIGFVPTCPGGPHCCDTDPCTCEAPAGPASAVYPNPVYAARFYPAAVARRYQATGRRRSSAVPAAVPDDAVVLDVPAWEQAGGGPVVRVAVVDTGWSQPFGGDCWLGSNPPLPNAAAGGGDSPDGDGDGAIDPVSGHGLFIAGLLLMYGPANIAVDVRHVLHPEGDGAESDVVKAIDALMTQRCPPHILNLSFGGYALEKPEALGDAITKAQKAGIIVVASAGNDGLPRKQYPAAFPGVISVAALGPNGPAPFSNWGEWVRACAPGVDLVSGFWDYDGEKHKPPPDSPERFDGWAMWSGTSFAAPMVAAALARDLADGLTASEAVSRRIDHPRLFRLACHGAVVNPMTRRPEI